MPRTRRRRCEAVKAEPDALRAGQPVADCGVPPASGATGRREFALYCTIAAASFTCGVWFARSALSPVGRGAFDDNAAHADRPAASATRSQARDEQDVPELEAHWSIEELRDRYRTAVAQVTYGQSEVARLKQELALARAQGLVASNSSPNSQPPAAPDQPAVNEHDTFYPPNPNELAQFVTSCTVRVDQPRLLDSTPGEVGDAADAMNAQPDEVRAMNGAMRDLHASFRTRLRALYAEAMGHPADTELSPRAMLGELQDKRPEENAGLFANIAKERAGELPEPTDLRDATPYERAQRLYLGLGDEFQQRVAQVLGPERAYALRETGGGWKWARSQFAGCVR
jgi:hypothetical protein